MKNLKELPFDIKYLSNQEWMPSEFDKAHMPDDVYEESVRTFNEAKNKVLFNGINVIFDSDGDEYQHHTWPYQIKIDNSEAEIFFEDDGLYIDNDGYFVRFPNTNLMTIHDFVDGLKLCKVEFELLNG